MQLRRSCRIEQRFDHGLEFGPCTQPGLGDHSFCIERVARSCAIAIRAEFHWPCRIVPSNARARRWHVRRERDWATADAHGSEATRVHPAWRRAARRGRENRNPCRPPCGSRRGRSVHGRTSRQEVGTGRSRGPGYESSCPCAYLRRKHEFEGTVSDWLAVYVLRFHCRHQFARA